MATHICWHGAGSFSLRLSGYPITVDPFFSRRGQYPDWYTPNPHAPEIEAFLATDAPSLVLITHGHFDHFDLETVRALGSRTDARFAGSAEVCETITRLLGIDAGRLVPLAPGDQTVVGPVRVRAHAGVHWFTGEEGSRVATRFAGRPERYGAMPCGGSMLSYILSTTASTPALAVYVSGDTRPEGVPVATPPIDVAVLNIGGRLPNPATGVPEYPITSPDEAPAVVARLRPKVVVPVHWDFPPFDEPITAADLEDRLGDVPGTRLVLLQYNQWVQIT